MQRSAQSCSIRSGTGPRVRSGRSRYATLNLGRTMKATRSHPACLCPRPAQAAYESPRTPKRGSAAAKALVELNDLVIAEKGALARRHERAPDGARLIELANWRTVCACRGLTVSRSQDSERKAFDRAVEKLSELAQIETFGHVVWLIKDNG